MYYGSEDLARDHPGQEARGMLATFDFAQHGVFPADYADSVLSRVVLGGNGLLYVLGETRGASMSVLRFDGKSRRRGVPETSMGRRRSWGLEESWVRVTRTRVTCEWTPAGGLL